MTPSTDEYKQYLDNEIDAAFNNMKTSDVSSEEWTYNNSAIKYYDFNNINIDGLSNDSLANAKIPADSITIGGKSLTDVLDKIQQRLAIIDDPSPENLKKFAALKKAYEQYKLLEKLCFEQGDDE